MSQRVDVDVSDNANDALLTADAYGYNARVLIYSSDAEDGTYVLVDTHTLITGETEIVFWDPVGTASTWYKAQYSDELGNRPSEFSEPFQAGALISCASLQDLTERLSLPDETRYGFLADLLVASSRYLDARIGFDFFRHPAVSGTETRVFDIGDSGRWRIPIYRGIVSATSVSMASSSGDTLTALDGADWYLYPRQLEPEGTYTHIALASNGSWPRSYAGQGVLSVTGAFGWPTPPTLRKEAELAFAARSWHDWQTKHAGVVGNPEFGTVSLSPYPPEVVHRCIQLYSRYWMLGV